MPRDISKLFLSYSASHKTLQVACLHLPATFYLSLFVSCKKSIICLFGRLLFVTAIDIVAIMTTSHSTPFCKHCHPLSLILLQALSLLNTLYPSALTCDALDPPVLSPSSLVSTTSSCSMVHTCQHLRCQAPAPLQHTSFTLSVSKFIANTLQT